MVGRVFVIVSVNILCQEERWFIGELALRRKGGSFRERWLHRKRGDTPRRSGSLKEGK
jgi:hypothetical protein